MNKEDKHFIERYEELLDKGYCDCNEMNCIDNNSPRRILNIVKDLLKQNEAYENMRKEAIECINKFDWFDGKIPDDIEDVPFQYCMKEDVDDLLDILNKVGGSDE